MESIDNMRKEFEAAFGRPAKRSFTACGRSELIGNHTDHQHGLVLACGVNLSAVALAFAQQMKVYAFVRSAV